MRRLLGFLLLLCLNGLVGSAQEGYALKKDPEWSVSVDKKDVKTGDVVTITFTSIIEKNWYMYSSDFDIKDGLIVASFVFEKHPSYSLVGKIVPVGSKKHYEEIWKGDVSIFTGKATFKQKVKILAPNPVIKGTIEFQECNEVSGVCMPPFDHEFSVSGITVSQNNDQELPPAASEMDTANPVSSSPADTNAQITNETKPATTQPASMPEDETNPFSTSDFWLLILQAIGWGFATVVTPCVFPMLPMTVTFFTKKSESRSQALKRAFTFGASIIAIYTSIGFLFSLLGLSADFANWISTHWVPNVFFFLIFIVFAASFLGMFEITLPSSFVNKIDRQSSMQSLGGVFFMAFTLVLVSFSCTGPIVGSLLPQTLKGDYLLPTIGMFAFSFTFALPFTLFAIFPSWLQSLPKSGGWLNSVKVVLGFLEIALAFKFLSIPDQTYHWGILDREVYIAIWVVTFFLLGLYLLGKLKFHHDSDMSFLSVPRLGLAMITFSFVVYLIPGMFGAPLKALSGYLPPQSTLDFDLYSNQGGKGQTSSSSSINEEIRYKNLFHLPHNLEGFFDYKQALAYSRKVNKPIFIDFTGHGCVNCREMEANVWSSPEVLKRLKEDFVIVAIYVDDKTELPENEWYTSQHDNKVKKSIGKQNADLQVSKYKVSIQPYYVIIDGDEKILTKPTAYDLNIDNFIRFLDDGKKTFSELHGKNH